MGARVARVVPFDSAAIETLTFDVRRLGVRGFSFFLLESGATQTILIEEDVNGTFETIARVTMGTNVQDNNCSFQLPVWGATLRVAFQTAAARRGVLTLFREPPAPQGWWPLQQSSVSVAAGGSSALVAQVAMGRAARVAVAWEMTQEGHLVFQWRAASGVSANDATTVATAVITGSSGQATVPVVAGRFSIDRVNDDGVNANVFTCCVAALAA